MAFPPSPSLVPPPWTGPVDPVDHKAITDARNKARFHDLAVAQYQPGFTKKQARELLLMSAIVTARDREMNDPSYSTARREVTRRRIRTLQAKFDVEEN